MLDIHFIRDNKEAVIENCTQRNIAVDIDRLLELDEKRRDLLKEVEDLRFKRNQGSKSKPTKEEILAMKSLGENIKNKEQELGVIEEEYQQLLLLVPNMTHPDVPVGGEDAYVVIDSTGTPLFDFDPKDHEEILLTKNLIDFERATKVTGSKFYFSRGDLVKLNNALLQYGIDIVTSHGYELLETPDLARQDILAGIGFQPRGEETQIYNIENSDLSLIGTAEITVGGMHADEILDLSAGPKKYVALSHCFRTEAGSYGRTSKGLYRVHQFTKLEMFIFCRPEESEVLHEELLMIERKICDGLELPYRVIDVASGDLGNPAYRKYDIEAWMTMLKNEEQPKGGYGEITSTSNCTDYQARRLKIRYRNDEGENTYVHTLNGTAIVSSRFPIALIENHQQKDGRITIPEKLQSYFGKSVIE